MRRSARSSEAESGAAVVDFVLVAMVLVPLVLGLIQVGLVLHVRNTLAAAATEAARYGATVDRGPAEASARAREQIGGVLAGRFADRVTSRMERVDGVESVVVRVRAEVPALGIWGPGVALDVEGHAVEELLP